MSLFILVELSDVNVTYIYVSDIVVNEHGIGR